MSKVLKVASAASVLVTLIVIALPGFWITLNHPEEKSADTAQMTIVTDPEVFTSDGGTVVMRAKAPRND